MFSKLKNYKDLVQKANEMKKNLADQTEQGTGANGQITISINGSQEITDVQIDQELINSNNQDQIQAGVKEAANNAIKKSQQMMADQMKQSGMGMPGM